MIKDFTRIHFRIVDAGEVTDIAEHFLIFTVPALLFFVEGKEVLREARFVHVDVLREKINRIYEALSD